MKPRRQPNWEERYAQPGCCCGREPVDFLREHLDELPRGAALDLAMGAGRNALFLAQHGFSVTGIDSSPTGGAPARAASAPAPPGPEERENTRASGFLCLPRRR